MRGRGVAAAARRRRDAAAAVERGGGAFCGSAARAAADDARGRSSPRRAPTRGGANRCRVHRAASREVFHATAGEGRREPAPPRTACTAARTAGGRGETSSSSTPRVLAASLASHRPPASPSRTRDRASAPGRPSPRQKTRTADAPGGRREHHRSPRGRAASAPREGRVERVRTMLLDRVKPLRCGSKEGRVLSVSGLFITPRARRKTRKSRSAALAFPSWYRSRARFGFGRTEHGSVEARRIARIIVRTLARF